MNRIGTFFNQKYFGKDLPFNYRIYMIFFFECLVISVFSAVTNTFLNKGLFGIAFQWTFIIFCIIVLFIPIKWRMAIMKPLLIFVSFVYIPFLFFQTAGYEGTASFFLLLAAFLLTIVFNGKARIAIVGGNLALWIIVCVLQYRYPQLVTPHGSSQAKFLDYIVALTLAASGVAVLGAYIKNTFMVEETRIRTLLKNEEYANKKLEDLTNRDPLTNAYNRRFLINFLKEQLNSEKELCIMMLDIDHFKKINDTWGHGFGDETLVRFTTTVQENLRKHDILARIGGEEFTVILCCMELEKAGEVAERIRKSVGEIIFENGAHITVSIGLVQARTGEGVDSVLNRADRYLYDAKSSGRNRIISNMV